MINILENRRRGKIKDLGSIFNYPSSFTVDNTFSYQYQIKDLNLDIIQNKFLISAFENKKIYIYDTENEFRIISEVVNTFRKEIEKIEWYPIDTGLFFTSSFQKHVRMWNTEIGKVFKEYFTSNPVSNFAINQTSLHSNLMAVSFSEGTSECIDLRTGGVTHFLRDVECDQVNALINNIKWHLRDENVLFTGSYKGEISMWDIRWTGKSISNVKLVFNKSHSSNIDYIHKPGLESMELSPDGCHLATVTSNGSVQIWDIMSKSIMPHKVSFLHLFDKPNWDRFRCAWIGSKKLVVPSSHDIEMFDINTGEIISFPSQHYSKVRKCVWNGSLNKLITTSADKTMSIWTGQF